MNNKDPLKGARDRYKKTMEDLSESKTKIAGAKARQMLADEKERNYRAKVTVVRWIFVLIAIFVISCVIYAVIYIF